MNAQNLPGYVHIAYDLYECPQYLLTDAEGALNGLIAACQEASLTVVNRLIHIYPNEAYSVSIFLSESHISLHTWPEHSYCALDIFLCSGDANKAEMSLLGFLQPRRQFKMMLSRGTSGPIPFGQWTTARGFPGYYEAYQTRRMLSRQQSPYQLIELFESEKFGKILLLDKDVQLSTSDEHIYHELLVHPAMSAHPAPKKVLVVGGADGGTLREVLKYDEVQKAVLVDIDKEVVNCCREFMPEVNQGAFDDSRVEAVYMDAADFRTSERFDVIIVDLTAPQGISMPAYRSLVVNIRSLLAPDGMLAMHSGWWWSRSDVDYPTMLLEEFKYALLKDQWIPSFSCFWSFLLAWRHDLEPGTALEQIGQNKRGVNTSYFSGRDYASSAFMKRFLPKITNK